ncbi:MAG: NAD(P)-dependent oxidoreductase [Sulfitobacter sp.]
MKVGFVGVGKMGLPMASRLLQQNVEVLAFDRSADALAQFCDAGGVAAPDPAAIADVAEIVFLSLPTPDIMASTVEAMVGGTALRIVVDLSTSGPTASRAAAGVLATNGKHLVDCPVSGGVTGARDGSLAMMVAGRPATVAEVMPYLEMIGRPSVVGEDVGMAQLIKLVNNLISTTALAVTSEALVLAVKAGLDPSTVIDVLNESSGRTSASASKIPKHVLNRRFDFGMAVGLSVKDIQLCLAEASRYGVPMFVGRTVGEIYTATSSQYGPAADMTEIIKTMEAWTGVEVGTVE